MENAKLSPIRAARRAVCPGSRILEEIYPPEGTSVFAREGTAAHWVAHRYLLELYLLPEIAPNGETITQEMRNGALLYEKTIKSISRTDLHTEEKININNVHPDCWGTPDCWVIDKDTLYIFDYKYGHGYVEVFENWQLLEYAAGISLKAGFDKITMIIVQPRCYTKNQQVNSWTITRAALYNYIEHMKDFEHKAMSSEAKCIPSPQCTFCSARHVCKALQDTAYQQLDVIKNNEHHVLDAKQTGAELKYLRNVSNLIEARMTGLEEQAKSMINRGLFVPGFRLESGLSRECWTVDSEEIVTLGELMGLDLVKSREIVTPNQARKLGMSEDILKQYTHKVSSKLKLVEVTDAARVFKND